MSTTETVQVLRAMRVRLEDPKRWTQLANARDSDWEAVPPLDQEAVCWCLRGAAIVDAARFGHGDTPTLRSVESLLTQSTESLGSSDFVVWQDTHTHAEMLTLLDRAIEMAEATSMTVHCWTSRWEADGYRYPSDASLAEMDRRWPGGSIPEHLLTDDPWLPYTTVLDHVQETCMLADGHKGPHAFQPTRDIIVGFGTREAS